MSQDGRKFGFWVLGFRKERILPPLTVPCPPFPQPSTLNPPPTFPRFIASSYWSLIVSPTERATSAPGRNPPTATSPTRSARSKQFDCADSLFGGEQSGGAKASSCRGRWRSARPGHGRLQSRIAMRPNLLPINPKCANRCQPTSDAETGISIPGGADDGDSAGTVNPMPGWVKASTEPRHYGLMFSICPLLTRLQSIPGWSRAKRRGCRLASARRP